MSEIAQNSSGILPLELQNFYDGLAAAELTLSPASAARLNEPGAPWKFPDVISGARHPLPLNPTYREGLERHFTESLASLRAFDDVAAAVGVPDTHHFISEAIGNKLTMLTETSDHLRPVDPCKTNAGDSLPADLTGQGFNPLKTREDVEAAISRADGWKDWATQAAVNMDFGAACGETQPQALLAATLEKQQQLVTSGMLSKLLAQALGQVPGIDATRAHEALLERAVQGYATLNDAIIKNLPHGMPDDNPGLRYLPNGEREYAIALQRWTGEYITDVPQLKASLEEKFAQTRSGLETILRGLGFSSLGSFNEFTRTDKRFYPFNTIEELERYYLDRRDVIAANGANVIDVPPRHLYYDIQFREVDKDDPLAFASPMYQLGSGGEDGRPGAMVLYVGDPSKHNIIRGNLYSVHEGAGHGAQFSVQHDLGLPRYLAHLVHRGEFSEGWAKYLEVFTEEFGLAVDDYTKAVELQTRIACYRGALVDIGIHYEGWGLDEAMRYSEENGGPTGKSGLQYIQQLTAWPGQVHSYNTSDTFMRCLEQARQSVPNFNLAKFNAWLISKGSVPMAEVRKMTEEWIGSSS